MRRRVAMLFAGLVVIGAGVFVVLHQRGGVVRLDNVEPVRAWFNANASRPRWVASLSPSCPTCLGVASALQDVVGGDGGHQRPALAVVWMVALRMDHLGPSAAAVARVPAAAQYFDKGHHLAQAMCAAVRAPEHVALCKVTPVLFGVVMGWPAGAVWMDGGLPEPVWMALDPDAEELRRWLAVGSTE
jgi:hypothetical protein